MAKHTHITPLLVQAIRSGGLPPRAALRIVLHRLASCCDDCRRVLEGASLPDLIPPSAYREPVARAVARFHELGRELAREHAEAARLIEPLRPLSPEQRLLRVRNALGRFARVPVGNLVLDASRACLPGDLPGSLAWAELAGVLAEHYRPPLDEHRVRALALQGNAHRALGDFDAGRRLLFEARDLCRADDSIEIGPEIGAEVDSFFGSLHTDLAEWDDALEHLERAASTYALTGDTLARARTFLQLGTVYGVLDRTDEAITADLAALRHLLPEAGSDLYLMARLNYAFHLQEAGRAEDSIEILEYDDTFYRDLENPHIESRHAWLQARLDADFGDHASAERRYLALQARFASRDDGFHAALVATELAILYLHQGRLADLERVAQEALTLFRAQSFHTDALAALLLLRRAARARSASLEQIRAALAAIRRTPRSALRPSR